MTNILINSIIGGVTSIIDLFRAGKREEAEQALLLLQTQANQLQGQLEINKIEAGHTSIFIAGARPFIMWTCGIALFNNYIIRPYVMAFYPQVEIPSIDNALFELMLGMLGIAGMRSFDKLKGIDTKQLTR